ncbi:hypothetical protein PIB30_101211, partial [Stylosanthes scabra]|nr:hypothetical protein [Stylosanthes scabra]
MEDMFDFFEDVDTKREHWRFQVYVVRMWKEMNKNTPRRLTALKSFFKTLRVGGSRHLSPDQCSRDMAVLLRSLRYVIAKVIGKEETRELTTVQGHETKRLALRIQDLEGNTIEVVLFGGM